MPDHSAIAFVRPGPDQSAVIRASVVGYAMPAESPPRRRARKRTSSVGAQAASRQAGIDSAMPEDQHQLAPVAIADRAEVEHRGGEAQGVADRDQIERRLARVELLGDRRQGDVRNREVQVRNRRDEDQRGEDER